MMFVFIQFCFNIICQSRICCKRYEEKLQILFPEVVSLIDLQYIFIVMTIVGPILGVWCLSITYQNFTNSFNSCHCVTHIQSMQFHSTNLYIEVAFDLRLTMEVPQPLFSLIPLSALLILCQSQPRAFTFPAVAFPASAHACVYTGCSNLMQIKQIQFGGWVQSPPLFQH